MDDAQAKFAGINEHMDAVIGFILDPQSTCYVNMKTADHTSLAA